MCLCVIEIFVKAGRSNTLIEADAEQAIENAFVASDNLLQSIYGLNLVDVITDEVFFGDIVLGSEGNDIAVGGSTLSFAGFSFNELIHAGNGDDNLIGGFGIDVFDGGNGQDTISFATFDEAVTINLDVGRTVVDNELKDYLYNIENADGSIYNDTLFGDEGSNFLFGNNGDDIMNGGANNDVLSGGEGTDTYQFNGAFGFDTVIDSDGLGSLVIDGGVLSGNAQKRFIPANENCRDYFFMAA